MVDRRVRRTRGHLHRALIELMLERGYDGVTVQDILDRADVGRSTFYAHYQSKDDLLVVSCAEFLRNHEGPARSLQESIRTLFDLTERHPELYRALVGKKSSGHLLRSTQQIFAEVLGEHLGEPADIIFLSWGLVGLIGAVAEGLPVATAQARFEDLSRISCAR